MRTFVLESGDGNRFAFDVSGQFPDFENNRELLKLLREHLPVLESPIRRLKHAPWIAMTIVLLLVAIALKMFGL